MFKLKYHGDTKEFSVHTQGQAWRGSLEAIRSKSQEIGIQPLEFEFGAFEIEGEDGAFAHFGIYGGYIFSGREKDAA